MRCTLSPATLNGGLNLVSRAVSPRSTLPVLANVLLETTEGGLRVTATNLDLSIAVTVPATVLEEGRTTVPARLLTDYVGSLGDGLSTIEVDQRNHVTQITHARQTTHLHGIDPVEFPPLPGRDGAGVVEIDSAQLERAVSQTTIAASADEASPVLTGVLIEVDGPRLTMVATDRHRLALKHLEATVPDGGVAGDGPLIVPARHLAEVARAVSASRPRVSMAVSGGRNQVFFSMVDVEISTRLIEGTYPNYAQVIPKEATTTVTVGTEALLRMARSASVLARDAGNPVRLEVGEGQITLLAQTAEVGDHRAALEGRVQGEEVQIAFNARYLVEALTAVEGPEVEMSFNGPLQPGVLRGAGVEDYLCIIMPVRVP